MSIPIEAKSFEFTPPSLKGIEGAPTFTLRYGTRRDRHLYQEEIARRNLAYYSEEEIRQVLLAEIKRLSRNSPEEIEKITDTAERYWAAAESLDAEITEWSKICMEIRKDDPKADIPDAPAIDFDAAEEASIVEIMKTVAADSELIGNMAASNVRYTRETREISIAAVLISVTGFEPKRRHDGLLEKSSVHDLEEWLGDMSETLGLSLSEAAEPFRELKEAAAISFLLPKEAEKNFASPPLSISSETNSTPPQEQSGDMKSKASAKSKETLGDIAPELTSESSTLPLTAETDGDGSNGPTADL